ncbi:hypothetical protein [Shouchella shacheensis]|uniref:hypothetical protein n=1 Tax=Shouchella shacheensis TaxID=1649580 RepID=UPI0007402E51|nr:hypothetical protein [Shouchella shacheensis]
MKQRAIICMLLTGIMIAYAYEQLPLQEEGISQVFAISWLVFAGVVLSGNVIGWIQATKKQNRVRMQEAAQQEKKERSSQYGA